MKKFVYTIISSFVCINSIFAQNPTIDSLEKAIIKINQQASGYPKDTNLINLYDQLAWEISIDRPDSSIILSEEVIKIAVNSLQQEDVYIDLFLKETNSHITPKQKWYIISLANEYHNLGEFYRLKGSYTNAIENSLKALAIWEKLKDEDVLSKKAATLANIGIFYTEQHDFSKALIYYNKALEIDKKQGDKKGLAADMGNMAILYAEQNDYEKALEFFLSAIKINEELGNKKGIASKLGNIGIIYKRKAEDLFKKEKSLNKEINDLYQKALGYFLQAQKLNEELGNKHGISINIGNIGGVYFSTGKIKQAEDAFFKSLEIDFKLGFKPHELDMYQSLYLLYDSIKQEKKGYAYYRKYIVLRDSLNNEQNSKDVMQAQMQYEFDKKEIARKSDQEKKDLIAKQEKQRQKIIIYTTSLGLILLLILVLVVFKGYRNKQKSNIEISAQKQIIESKQKEIIDSIQYAKRIQTSILPSEKYINRIMKNNKIILIVFFLNFLSTSVLISQNSIIDSFKVALKTAIYDTTKCNILNTMIEEENDMEVWSKYNDELKKIAEKNISNSTNFKTKKVFLKHYANSLNNIGYIFNKKGEVSKALEYYFKSLKISEEIDDKEGTGTSLNNIGQIYGYQGETKKSLEYYLRSLEIYKKLDNKYLLGGTLNNIASAYDDMGELSKAKIYYNESLKLLESIGDKYGIAFLLQNIGAVNSAEGDIEKALESYQKCLKIRAEINDKEGMAFVLNSIGELYFKKQNFSKALNFSKQSLEISQKNGIPENTRYASKSLYKMYKKTNQPAEALKMYELYIQMRDSIKNEETKKASIKSQLKYEYEKKAATDSVRVEKEKEITKAQLKQEETFRYSLYVVLLLTIIFGIFMINRFNVTRQQKNIIQNQKEIVEEKQKEIIDSINYAKRIQTALLPNENYIHKILKRFNSDI